MNPADARRILGRIVGSDEVNRRYQARQQAKLQRARPKGNRRLSTKGKLLVQSLDWLYNLRDVLGEAGEPKKGPPPIPTHKDTLDALRSVRATVTGTSSAAEMRKRLQALQAKARKAGIKVTGKGRLPGLDADADLHTRSVEALGGKGRPKPTLEAVATKKHPKKWAAAKSKARAKMGGKHSARAMQLAVHYYKKMGGGYAGKKPSAKQNKLRKWTKQDWQTRPGTHPIAKRKDGSTARYLPKKKWRSLSKSQQVATDKKKRSASKKGKGIVPNTRAARVSVDEYGSPGISGVGAY